MKRTIIAGATSLFVGTMALSGCESTTYKVDKDQITLSGGAGGLLKPIGERYHAWERLGYEMIIDGRMVSADALRSLAYPGACYTPNAVFVLHALSSTRTLGLIGLPAATEREARKLPAAIAARWREHASFRYPLLTLELRYEEMLDLWPEGACDYLAPSVAAVIRSRR